MAIKTLLFAGFAALCSAQSTFSPLRPPSLPLAVRSPYFSTWQQAGNNNGKGGNGGYLPGQWPSFWFGAPTGWTGYIRVDNITYTWMGSPAVSGFTNYFATQTGYQYTSTRSIFTLDVAGEIEMTVTFLSPVLPDTMLEMSLPYSYMDVAVSSLDGSPHSVELYTDISAEWVDGDRSSTAEWSYDTVASDAAAKSAPAMSSATSAAPGPFTTYATQVQYTLGSVPTHGPAPIYAPGQGYHPQGVTQPPAGGAYSGNSPIKYNNATGGVAYHRVWRQQQLEFSEKNEQAQWGYWYYATDSVKNLTYQSGSDASVRAQFISNGFLNNSQDTNYRAISDNYPVFGYAIDLGNVTKDTPQSHMFQLSLHQQNCIRFEEAAGNTSVPCMWTNFFDSETSAVSYFYSHYEDIKTQSLAVDNKVQSDSVAAGGQDYASLTSLAVRQAFGALAYTGHSAAQPWVFLKEISSDGDIQTVDVLFPFFPILTYFNSDILRYVLDPLFINQEAGYWPYAFSMHDLGIFPNAVGYNNLQVHVEQQPVEECGNMILMALAYAQRTNDNAYLSQHYSLLRQWNQYLVNFTLVPGSQLSTDDFLGFVQNDTNLALKGIVGIEAMAQIANRTGNTADALNFTNIAHDYIAKWQTYGINTAARPPHTATSYGENNTFSILYNLYPDALLSLNLVPKSVYNMQSSFYPTVFKHYGVPLRSSVTTTKVDWELWAAAISSSKTQKQFLSIITTWLDQTTTNFAFTDWYNVDTSGFGGGFTTRPVVGGMFSILALQSAPTAFTLS